MLHITFMGETRFLLDGVDVSDKISSKATAIVALVLMKESRQMRRSEIINFLWGGRSICDQPSGSVWGVRASA